MLRAREDKALEVWFGGGRKPVGWMTGQWHRNIPLKTATLLLGYARRDDVGDLIEETRGFDLTKTERVIEAVEVVRYGAEWLDKQIPSYAAGHKPLSADKIRYAWNVLRLTDADDYDWVFDHPDFEPADTVADRDARLDPDYLAQMFADDLRSHTEDALNYAVFGGSVPTYATGGFHANTVAQATSANSSCMTLEKLEKTLELARKTMGLPLSALT
jgi:hypothetical protein